MKRYRILCTFLALVSFAGSAHAALSIEERVNEMLGRMSLDEKLGQMTQADLGKVSAKDAADLNLGSILSGADAQASPGTLTGWADTYDRYQQAALNSRLAIPLLFGQDAVHGLNFFKGATIFPHNIGLGATRDPQLAERIGRATAEEAAATGINWTFAPCVAVAKNDRWGRTYEAFGEVSDLVIAMSSIIDGFQSSSGQASILATAKHYVGDGATEDGIDRGDARISEETLRSVHLRPFQEAVRREVATVMVSFSSWNGTKMHSHRYLITDVLKGELNFQGFVISDWNGVESNDTHSGYSAEDVRMALNAGIDMFMVPSAYRRFIEIAREEVYAGRVPLSRIDDAVRRILRMKYKFGLFERPFAKRELFAKVGGDEHRKLAREAVQKSLVLLKNSSDILPLSRTIPKLFVAGKSAENIGFQSGGWTINWQGGDGAITTGTTILQGIRNTLPGTQVVHSAHADGIDSSFAAAIAVIGERPYSEQEGDRRDDLKLDRDDLDVLAKLKASGVPLIVVLVSGRPLDISEHINGWEAFIAAWLPGSEGQGVADILFGMAKPSGKLPVTWMTDAWQQPINAGDGKTGLFSYGFGLTYR